MKNIIVFKCKNIIYLHIRSFNICCFLPLKVFLSYYGILINSLFDYLNPWLILAATGGADFKLNIGFWLLGTNQILHIKIVLKLTVKSY